MHVHKYEFQNLMLPPILIKPSITDIHNNKSCDNVFFLISELLSMRFVHLISSPSSTNGEFNTLVRLDTLRQLLEIITEESGSMF